MAAGPSQPPLWPSSLSPEQLHGVERIHTPEDRWKSPRAETGQWPWLLLNVAAFGLVFGGAVLLVWLLGR